MSEASQPDRHLVFFERAGDARAAFGRADAGGDEYHQGERRTVELKRDLAERFGRATVVTATGGEAWDQRLTPHLRAVGLGADASASNQPPSPGSKPIRPRTWSSGPS